MLASVGLCLALVGCGVVRDGAAPSAHAKAASATMTRASGLCAIQTAGLLDQTKLSPNLTPQSPPLTAMGPLYLLDGANDGSTGHVDEYFQSTGAVSPMSQVTPTLSAQVRQLGEQIEDYGSAASAERWMSQDRASNQPNDVAMFGNGVERNPPLPSLGDDTFVTQIDVGAPYTSTPYLGPYVGHIHTNVEVRDGELIFAVSVDSDASGDPVTLAVSVVRKLLAKEHTNCS
jgi:hypothetical protein